MYIKLQWKRFRSLLLLWFHCEMIWNFHMSVIYMKFCIWVYNMSVFYSSIIKIDFVITRLRIKQLNFYKIGLLYSRIIKFGLILLAYAIWGRIIELSADSTTTHHYAYSDERACLILFSYIWRWYRKFPLYSSFWSIWLTGNLLGSVVFLTWRSWVQFGT